MQVKLSPLGEPLKNFKVNLNQKVKVYDKVLLTETEKEASQLKNNDWIVFLGKMYSVEVVGEVPKVFNHST